MSYAIAAPELMAATATDLAAIGSTLNAAHMTAVPPTLALLPAAADEVSASIAHLFSGYGRDYQALASQAAAFHAQFVQHLTAGAISYAAAEAANVSLLQPFTAIADSIRSAGVVLLDQLFNSLSSYLYSLFSQAFSLLFPAIFPILYQILGPQLLFVSTLLVVVASLELLAVLSTPYFVLRYLLTL